MPHPTPHAETPELLAPAGNWDCVRAAAANGADAVYFGLPRFNARLRADNFTEEELPEVVAYCHRAGVKAYVAFNTLVFTGELEAAADYLRLLSRAGVDALIVQDVGLVRLAREIVPDLPIHASTQMSITSPEGVRFARELGVERVVLARELSLRELEKFEPGDMPLEVFVHGALCVAYSGQCLTSESLGQRSANRGECAQACRMPYELVVDGALRDLGDKRYLLSPQDLAAVNEIPQLVERGVISFKIEGRLKSPEYVAAVCQVYRKALDAALEGREHQASAADRYQLEMTFSRGLFSGWMHGVNHQELVSARFGKKRGPLAGTISAVAKDHVEIDPQIPLQPGDGVVFDTGGDTNHEQGGRIFQVKGRRLYFQHGHIQFGKLQVGDRVWKTDDPALDKQLRQSFTRNVEPRRREAIDLRVSGRAGEPMVLSSGELSVHSTVPLQQARTAPLATEKLREHLGRFGENPFSLGHLENALDYFRDTQGPLRLVGDFSLNVANPLSAQVFMRRGLEHLTISYDLNIEQVLDLLAEAPPEWFELTIHQHMPMFHMEHCVFAAFLSEGKSFMDCGRPCEKHRVHLKDRVGMQHPLRADVGCRNTVFNAVPQTGARFFESLQAAGLRRFRVELLEESRSESARVIRAYQRLQSGERAGEDLWQDLRAQSQLGVTRGTY